MQKRQSGIWGMLVLCLLSIFLIFYYGDLGCTLENAVLLVDALVQGEFLNYYEYSITHVTSYWAANYDLPIYIIFAIWNLPVIFARWFFGLSVSSGWALMWCKGLIVVFTLATVRVIYKLCKLLEVEEEGALLACFLFLSSLTVVAPAFMIGQYDCISLFFMLAGLYYYLQGKQKWFMICFMIAVPLKMFALFMVIPLILLQEKRLHFIFLKTGITCIPWLFFKFIFSGDPAYKIAVGAQSRDGLLKLVGGSEGIGGWPVCIFLGIFIGICVFCFLRKEDREDKQLPIYLCFWVFTALITFLSISDYWIMLAAPFIILCIVLNPCYFKVNLLVETISGGAYLLFAFITKMYPYNYPDLVKKMVLPHIMETPTPENAAFGSISIFLTSLGIDKFASVFYTIFFVGMLTLVVINRPKKHTVIEKKSISWGQEMPLLWMRICVIVVLFSMVLYANLSKMNVVSLSTLDAKRGNSGYNLLDGYEIVQGIEFEEEKKLQELKVLFINTNESRENMSSVVIEIYDRNIKEPIFSTRIGSNSITSEGDTKIKLKDVTVEPGKTYFIRITGKEGVKGSQYYIAPMETKFGGEDIDSMYVNGKLEESSLCFQIR